MGSIMRKLSHPFALSPMFAGLLVKTAGVPHGIAAPTQEDDEGNVWSFIAPLRREGAWRLLWDAMCGGHSASLHTEALLPGNDQFIIFGGNDTFIWSLYQRDGRFYIMRADGRRYYNLQLRGRYQSDAALHVYETLHQLYGTPSGV
jgi:hypothetical protein